MDNQLTLMEFEPPNYKEELFLNQFLPAFRAAVSSKGGNCDLIKYRATQTDSDSKSKSGGYTSVFFHNFTAFRLKLRGKQFCIILPTIFSDLIPQDFPVKRLASEPKYIRIMVDSDHPIEAYADFLTIIVGETVNRYPKEWDCCSRYMECSDAKTCTHPDKAFALGCGYRRILSSGRIFYGKNRNID